ncbi:MAG: hypothetical protein ACOZBH_02105 [Patescibacteria group bacterium]
MDQKNQSQFPQSMEPIKPDNDRNKLAIIIAVILLTIGIIAFTIFYLVKQNILRTEQLKESAASYFPFIPVIAIFIPSMFIKKSNQPPGKQRRQLLAVVIATVIIVMASVAAWIFLSQK